MEASRHDVVVVGAGPAGLSAAAELAHLGVDVGLVEAGSPSHLRDRHDPRTVACGVGGAGLFSDGKFSFFPSATALWQLADPVSLDLAWMATARFLESFGVLVPPHGSYASPGMPSSRVSSFSHRIASAAEPAISACARGIEGDEVWTHKEYPSVYVSLDARAAMTEALVSQISVRHPVRHPVRLGARLVGVSRSAERSTDVRLDVLEQGILRSIETRVVVLATGRFLPLQLDALAPALRIQTRFRRLEIGARIEDDAGSEFFSQLRGVDPKLVLPDAARSLEWRTFCCCRDGEVVTSVSEGLWSTSGRADGPSTRRSNLGVNVRILDATRARRLLPEVIAGARRPVISVPLWPLVTGAMEARNELVERVGDEIATLLIEGLSRLIDTLPVRPGSSAIVHAPGLEGLGEYPDDDGCLRLSENAWVAGDGGGRFRGIVAAMVSGRFVAHRIAREAMPR